jgi:Uma2 family endonuclease
MGRAQTELKMDLADYLIFQAQTQVKYEYAAGSVFAMAGATEKHNRISGNVFALLHAATRGSSCIPFVSDMRVRMDEVVYYPDVMVCCDSQDSDPLLKQNPCLIVEVLSDSTERIDRGEKLYNYQKIAALKAYVLIAQDRMQVEIYRRTPGKAWSFEIVTEADAVIELECPKTSLRMADIYERVDLRSRSA